MPIPARIVEAARVRWRHAGEILRGDATEATRRRRRVAAVLLVVVVAAAKHVIGLTPARVPFTMDALAVMLGAAYGGFDAGVAATMTAVLLVNLDADPRLDWTTRLLFASEGCALAALTAGASSRLRVLGDRIASAQAANAELQTQSECERDAHRAAHAASERAWADYRDKVTAAQADMKQAVADANRQLATIEALTDPDLDAHDPNGARELLERLRATIGADGIALVDIAEGLPRIALVVGLQPQPSPRTRQMNAAQAGRVALVHNNARQVQEISAVEWPARVRSLMVVPVLYRGSACAAIEVAGERPKPASDWDLALLRIVADRVAALDVRRLLQTAALERTGTLDS